MKKLPKSIRKYIRKEKARIRREFSSIDEQNRLIDELYQKLLPKSKNTGKVKHYENSRDIQLGNQDGNRGGSARQRRGGKTSEKKVGEVRRDASQGKGGVRQGGAEKPLS